MKPGERSVGVAIFVLRTSGSRDDVLLLQRAGGGFEGTWCPVAGKAEDAEVPEETARRELQEETSLVAGEWLRLPSRIVVPTKPGSPTGVISIFAARVDANASVTIDYEHRDFRWMAIDEALTLLPLEDQREALREVERVVLQGKPPLELEFQVQP